MAKADAPPIVEELYFRSESAYLCLLLNRRTRTIRVIDFRAGALPAKRLFIQSVARRENVEKVFTLVEKDEVSSWTRVGFVREGTIPGFYKRSDGHLCGCVITDKAASIEVGEDGIKLTERTVNGGKRIAKDIPEEIKGITIREVDASDALGARDTAWKGKGALGSFDTFGRDAERLYLDVGSRRSGGHLISAEYQECFGHSLVELLKSPVNENEVIAITAGLRTLSETLKNKGIVSAFGLGPNDDENLSAAFLASGFRKTGLLARGIRVGNTRRDAILWTRKLANPGGDDDLT